MRKYDLCVIGSGPGGQKGAIQAAKLGKRACVVEKMEFVGGVAINTGTIPSKALREAVLAVTSLQEHAAEVSNIVMDQATRLKRVADSCSRVIRAEVEIVRGHLISNGIDLYSGTGKFRGPTTIEVEGAQGTEVIEAANFLIATGTTPARPKSIPFDTTDVITSDELLRLPYVPRTMMVVGGGVIGTEYASMLTSLGMRVTLIEGRNRLLDFVDSEICEALQYHLRKAGLTLRMGEKVVSIKRIDPPAGARVGNDAMVEATLESGKTLRADALMYCVGRQGCTDLLNLGAAGLEADDRGRIKVNERFQTQQPHIYAVGDVIGFPALASTSMEQGRLAACAMFGERADAVQRLLPYGIYSIPEISMVGWTEDQLTKEGIPYEAGVAQYQETARGHLLGDDIGMLKLLIHQESHAILGVHIIGTQATELVHIGQAVMAFNGTVEHIVNTVFNYPTLAECYKIAALNGLNKLKSI
ncbi:MAG: Si-specific NAD(P)(+) transhydrogenase [Phycisphaeraceae bacterium]|nr:Si-specific NAD(P)(+) transhydrogenase [Phycisphaeraceae bacterium]